MVINGKKLSKIILGIIIVMVLLIIIFSVSTIFKETKQESNENEILNITTENYTTFLKDAHENIDKYLDKKITISGYVYRMPDFDLNQFVLSRTMMIDSNDNGVVVGILAEYKNAIELNDNDWVNITGTITKGNYKGEMPMLKVDEITKVEVPENELVYPPSGTI